MPDDDHQEQSEFIRQELAALAKLSPTQRRRHQLLVVHCKGCSDVLMEVLDGRIPTEQGIEPWPIVRHRLTHSTAVTPPPRSASRADAERHWATHFQTRKEAIRLDPEWRFTLAPPADERSLLAFACRCTGDRTVDAKWIREQIESGRRTATL